MNVQWGRVGCKSWHTNLSGFIPPSGKLNWNLVQHLFVLITEDLWIKLVISAIYCYHNDVILTTV